MPNIKPSITTFFIFPFLFGICYFLIFLYFNNLDLINKTMTGDFSLKNKIRIVYFLITGVSNSFSSINLSFLLIISFLTGLNLSLLMKRFIFMKNLGHMKFVIGSSSILGLVSSGCASCGLPLLAFFGLSSSIGFLPLKGYEFSIITVLLLLLSTFILIKQLNEKPKCKTKLKKSL